MDMRPFAAKTFLKTVAVSEGPLLLWIAEIKPGKYDKPDIHFESGEILSLNATNTAILVRAYGPDSNAYIRKQVELSLGKVPFQGELQDSIVIKPISPATDAAERTDLTAKIDTAEKTRTKNGDMDDEIPF
jgi:hypothetical protein